MKMHFLKNIFSLGHSKHAQNILLGIFGRLFIVVLEFVRLFGEICSANFRTFGNLHHSRTYTAKD